MSTEEKKHVVERFFNELWNRRRLEVASEIISQGCITHQLRSGSPDTPAARNPEILTSHITEWLRAFPDLQFAIDALAVDGELVFTRATASGTHEGTWLGVASTGRRITIRMAVTFRVVGGKIVEDWVLVDFLGVFQQLGLIPATDDLVASTNKT